MNIVEQENYRGDFLDKITNRELSTRLYEFYGVYPLDPVEYLRYIVYLITCV
jgi:hypothetical protein